MADRMLAEHRNLAIKREMTVRREEYLEYLTFQRPGPPIFTEIFGPLIGLKEEWAAQGATPSELDFSAYRFRHPLKYGVRVNTGWFGGPEPVVLEETDEDIIGRDRYGRKVRLVKSAASLPLPIDYPVTTMDDWQAIKSHYAFTEDRFGKNWLEEARKHRDQGYVITIGVPGGFDEARQLLGEGALCETYYTNPDLVHDILTTIGDTACRILERVVDAIPIDTLQIHEDMAGKSGPLVGPRQIEDFIGPYYRRVWNLVQERGTPLFDQDSDGDMRPVLAAFLDTGLNMTHPNEPAAGMDVVAMRAEYGERLVLVGGLDKHVIRRTQEEIEAELEYKIPPMVRTGGCVLGLDHRIPNGTPLANYRFYIEKAWEIMTREWREISGEDEIV